MLAPVRARGLVETSVPVRLAGFGFLYFAALRDFEGPFTRRVRGKNGARRIGARNVRAKGVVRAPTSCSMAETTRLVGEVSGPNGRRNLLTNRWFRSL